MKTHADIVVGDVLMLRTRNADGRPGVTKRVMVAEVVAETRAAHVWQIGPDGSMTASWWVHLPSIAFEAEEGE